MVIYGYTYAGGFIAGGLVVTFFAGWPWAIPFWLLAVFCLNFFRDPERIPPTGPYALSPADGKVMGVAKEGNATRISIFLNVFDVHVNRTPIPGKLSSIVYKQGAFLNAANPQASAANEQNVMVVDGTVGGKQTRIVFSQIAGLIARRIICYKQPGDTVAAAERIGLMKFGSRMDVTLGPEWNIQVQAGQRVVAGISILATLGEAK